MQIVNERHQIDEALREIGVAAPAEFRAGQRIDEKFGEAEVVRRLRFGEFFARLESDASPDPAAREMTVTQLALAERVACARSASVARSSRRRAGLRLGEELRREDALQLHVEGEQASRQADDDE